jgi:rhodanese-related sulfurtransferase
MHCFAKNAVMIKQILSCFGLFILFLSCRSQNTYNEITLPELMKKKHNSDKNMVIVDVRTKGEYYDTISRGKQSNIGHIKGAINIPVQDLQQTPDAVKQLDAYKDKDIYLICSHSYRSRAASNILLKNGFIHVNNVQGGMTEWYRRYDELSAYRDEFLEKGISYNNISPAQLLEQLTTGKKVLFLGIRNTAKMWYDSFNIKLYRYYPLFKNTVYFNYADSLKILEEAQKQKGQPVVLFNLVNNGAAELAEWLTAKGISNVSYLVGGENYFYEYVQNKQASAKADKFLTMQSGIRFITPAVFCNAIPGNKNLQMIDTRHDSLFNKINEGTKHNYKHLKDAANFFEGNGAALFEQKFIDRKKEYVLVSENGIDGLEFADALAKKGYTIHWLIGGLQRWEWYMNNVEDFSCNDFLVQ